MHEFEARLRKPTQMYIGPLVCEGVRGDFAPVKINSYRKKYQRKFSGTHL